MILIRPMRFTEGGECADLAFTCHPGWPGRTGLWDIANPTLVAQEDGVGVIRGHASFTIDATTNIMHLRDTCVHPDSRRLGIARDLMEERLDIGVALGIRTFIGCTWADNTPMVRLLGTFGFHACQPAPRYFKDNDPPADGIIYVKAGQA